MPEKPKKGRKKQESSSCQRRASYDSPLSRSAKKIRLEDESTVSNTDFFFVISFSILNCIVEEVNKHVAACKAKDPYINVELLDDQKMGFAQKLKICCRSCLWKIETFTSRQQKLRKMAHQVKRDSVSIVLLLLQFVK